MGSSSPNCPLTVPRVWWNTCQRCHSSHSLSWFIRNWKGSVDHSTCPLLMLQCNCGMHVSMEGYLSMLTLLIPFSNPDLCVRLFSNWAVRFLRKELQKSGGDCTLSSGLVLQAAHYTQIRADEVRRAHSRNTKLSWALKLQGGVSQSFVCTTYTGIEDCVWASTVHICMKLHITVQRWDYRSLCKDGVRIT